MDASVEITPKLISAGACAAAVRADAATVMAVAAQVRKARIMKFSCGDGMSRPDARAFKRRLRSRAQSIRRPVLDLGGTRQRRAFRSVPVPGVAQRGRR